MFDSYLKGVYSLYVYGWSESSCNTDYGKDEVTGFFRFYKIETSDGPVQALLTMFLILSVSN